MSNVLKCHGCRYFYVTYKQSKPMVAKHMGLFLKYYLQK